MPDINTDPRYTKLPCGCIFGTEPLPDGGNAFIYRPCSLDCQYYLYSQQAAAEQGKPLKTIDLSDPTGTSVEVPVSNCPACGYKLDAVTDTSGAGASPSEDDWSLCIGCYAALRFNADLSLRLPTEADLEQMPPELAVLQRRAMDGSQR